MEPFKEKIDARAVEALAGMFSTGWDRAGFLRADGQGWQPVLAPLELKARVVRVADALRAHLPPRWADALELVLVALPEAPTSTDGVSGGFGMWPLLTLVERHGLDDPERSLAALRRLTPHFSAEFAVRPYLAADPDGVRDELARWVDDPNPHVRRLVSEGSRPRLPWGARLADRIDRPETWLPVLERLRDDPEAYVRRSVANHVNDIAKDHPELVLRLCGDWLVGASPERVRLVRHALRTQLKAGDARAFALLGLEPPRVDAALELLTPVVSLGGSLALRLSLRSRSDRAQRVKIDLGLHHRRADGSLSTKVFAWTTRALAPGETQVLTREQAIRPVTTRRVYAGLQAVDVRINGVPGEAIPWELVIRPTPTGGT